MEKHQTSHRQVNLRQHLKSGWRSTTKRKKRLNVKMHQGNLLHSQVTPYHQVFLPYGNCLLHCYHHLLEGTLNSQEKSGVNFCLTYGIFHAWVPQSNPCCHLLITSIIIQEVYDIQRLSTFTQRATCIHNHCHYPSVTHSAAPRVPLFCSFHILMSSVIYYWTDTLQLWIYLLNRLRSSLYLLISCVSSDDV